jgi:hypothetical protein
VLQVKEAWAYMESDEEAKDDVKDAFAGNFACLVHQPPPSRGLARDQRHSFPGGSRATASAVGAAPIAMPAGPALPGGTPWAIRLTYASFSWEPQGSLEAAMQQIEAGGGGLGFGGAVGLPSTGV